ncbi:hypothetical protein CLAIMM_13792 [Cladophialophora immunda]|nr:hypothetical protein CLAIMM_13792 [Cladophialophora immunda]
MAYSVLLLGATSRVGSKTLEELALQREHFSRVAFLLPPPDTPYQETEVAPTTLERIHGNPSDSGSYHGFQVVVSAVEDKSWAKQEEYAEAAFAGGVKHFYPAECESCFPSNKTYRAADVDGDGPDLNHPAIKNEQFFAGMVAMRKHIEARVQTDNSLGFTCIMTGASSDLLLESNALALSDDQRSAIYLGNPTARVSVTHSDDVAKFIVASLLPHHLYNLNLKRYLCFAASTLPNLSLFDAVSYVLRHPIDVTYEGFCSSHEKEEQQKAAGDKVPQSFRRSVGFGGFELKEQDVAYNREKFRFEVKAKTWAQVVYEFFTNKEPSKELSK